MRPVHLVSALAASYLAGFATDASFAVARAEPACGSGYHSDSGGNCQPDVAETNRFCPKGAVPHPWINGGFRCEFPEPTAARAEISHEVQARPAPRPHRRARVARRATASAAARPIEQTRSIPAPNAAPAVPINPGFSAPPAIHSGSAGGAGGGGGGGWSDRRLKRDIVRLGHSPSGLPIYAFQYVWGGPRYIGVMAQDLLKLRPDAVILDESGYYKVDYSRVDVEMREELQTA